MKTLIKILGYTTLAFIALSGPLISFLSIHKTSAFREHLLLATFEGTISEDLGLLTALTAELAAISKEDPKLERALAADIADVLQKMKSSFSSDFLHERFTTTINTPNIAPSPQEVSLLDLGDLDLAIRHDKSSRLRCVESSSSNTRPYFTFIPAPLVAQQGNDALADSIKSQTLLSQRVLENFLPLTTSLRRIEASYDTNILQAYFIPYSGMITVLPLDNEENGELQKRSLSGRFKSITSFSDRTYFYKSRANPSEMNITAPYIDVAGGGLIKTYSIYLRGPGGQEGMLALDRRLSHLVDTWGELNLGSPLLPDFSIGRVNIGHQDSQIKMLLPGLNGDRSLESPLARVEQRIRQNPKELLRGIQRFSFPDDENTTIFTVPLSSNEYGWIMFSDALRRYREFAELFLHVVAVLATVALTFLIVSVDRSRSESERANTKIFNSIHAGVVTVSARDRIIFSNEQFSRLVSRRTCKGKKVADFLGKDIASEYATLQQGDSFELPGRLIRSDGAEIPVIAAGCTVSRGRSTLKAMVFIPSENLEVAIGKKFLNIFSHALKTPLHSILLVSESFRRSKNKPKFNHYFSIFEKEVSELKLLTDNLLSFAEVESVLEYQTYNVAQDLRKIVSSGSKRAKYKGLQLISNIPGSVSLEADRSKVTIVFNNLLDNALKYTDSGRIEISAHERAEMVHVKFRDTGIGISPADKEAIFRRFFRSDTSRVRSEEGMGIGLFVSKWYVEEHGGKIYCRDWEWKSESGETGHGTEFELLIPKRRPHDEDQPKATDSTGGQSSS